MARTAIAGQIERRLEQVIGAHIAVEEDEGALVVSGMVSSEAERQAIFDIIEEVAPGRRVEDNLEILETMPGTVGHAHLADAEVGSLPGSDEGLEENEALEPGDFTDREALGSADLAAGPRASIDEDLVAEGDEVWVPPTDPVTRVDETGRAYVVGGLQQSSMDSIEVERSAFGGLGDEAIAEAIRRELLEDAATTEFAKVIEVEVEQGVVTLRGRVPMLMDAESAEEVAARVPGVVEVREELDVADME
jgi:osmotically-inducible protein OsmY